MNYEQFNDAMCRLRQAEEDFNKALQDAYSTIDKAYLNDSSTELQAQNNEEYRKGLKDMHEALRLIATDGLDGGMPISEMKDVFGTSSVLDIILRYPFEEIIDKTLAWTTKRRESQELHVGDEIEYTYPGRKPEKCIVVSLENGIGKEKIIWTIDLESLRLSWFSSNCYWDDTYHKTGKHYDSILLNKEETNK